MKRFQDFCEEGKNETFCRYLFNIRNQKEGEGFDDFLTAIRELAKDCVFANLEIRDRIVCGCLSKEVRERLLRESKLNLDRAIEIIETIKLQLEKRRNMAKRYYDRKTRPLKPLKENEFVRMETRIQHNNKAHLER